MRSAFLLSRRASDENQWDFQAAAAFPWSGCEEYRSTTFSVFS